MIVVMTSDAKEWQQYNKKVYKKLAQLQVRLKIHSPMPREGTYCL